MTYRPGNHWGVTIIRDGDQPADEHGRRQDDELVAVVVNGDPDIARRMCAGLNSDNIEREDQYRFELDTDGGGMWARCLACSTELVIDVGQSLADLVDRAGEHVEVCR